MNYKRFDINIIVAILIISATNYFFFWALTQPDIKLTLFYIVLLQIAEIIWLISYVRKNNHAILGFLNSIKNNDALIKLKGNENELSFNELRKVLAEIADSYQEIKMNKESDYQYFQRILSSIGIGVITCDKDGKTDFVNQAALSLFKIEYLNNLKELNRIKPSLSESLCKLSHNNQNLLQIKIDNLMNEIVVKAIDFKIRDRDIKLISLQNINSELESRESVAWNKLIRVLNHEIMNSIGPITSLSASLIDRYQDLDSESKNKEISPNIKKSTLTALNAIEKRSNGLSKFIESYRDLAKFRELNFSSFSVLELFERIETLNLFENYSEDYSFIIKKENIGINLTADEKYLEQILINLIKNAIEAKHPDKPINIELSVLTGKDDKVSITLSDNGLGILDEDMEDIFTPFYSTKDDGSGIGLSVCRQIMRLHSGSIKVSSIHGQGSTFTLEF